VKNTYAGGAITEKEDNKCCRQFMYALVIQSRLDKDGIQREEKITIKGARSNDPVFLAEVVPIHDIHP
jgi:hypothetical protein